MQAGTHFSVEQLSGVTTLKLVDPHLSDTILVTEFERELETILANSPTQVVVDFAAVSQCSTAVINTLINWQKKLRTNGGEVKICRLRDTVRQAFRILKLEGTLFSVYDELDEAIAAFQ